MPVLRKLRLTTLGKRLGPWLRRWLRVRRLLIVAAVAVALIGGALGGSMLWVRQVAGPHIYSLDSAPRKPVALVLGALVNADATPSPILVDRLEAARELYLRGRVRAILVSGDNGSVKYNEVDPMRQWLVERGVPETRVVGDYAGFDTYSSCVRAVRIFGVRDAVVVTQAFHLPRAVTLCREVGMDAIGVRASTSGLSGEVLRRLSWRDNLASVKAAAEIIARPDPKYLGRHETGVETALAAH